MKRSLLTAFFVLFMVVIGYAGDDRGRLYYDLGVYAYEKGEYSEAEQYVMKALTFAPYHPLYNHLMGKIFLKTGHYQESKKYLSRTREMRHRKAGINMTQLQYDQAYLNYKTSDYSGAIRYFREVIRREPSDLLAGYYIGISLFRQGRYRDAINYFEKTAEHPDIRMNSECYPGISDVRMNSECFAGICYLKTGRNTEAFEKFTYVKDNSSDSLRRIAIKWLHFLGKQENVKKNVKPYHFYLKTGYRYDDNVQLRPLDEDAPTNQADYLTEGAFSGKYSLVNTGTFHLGAGYSHYQKYHNELKEYDLTGSIFTLSAKYRLHPLTFGFSYLPSYYWINSESYLMCHQFRPEISWTLDDRISSRLSFSFYEDNHFQDYEKDGHTNDFFLDVYYNLFDNNPDKKGYLFGGIGYEDKSSSQAYGQYKAQAGISLEFPGYLNLGLRGKYYRKKYDDAEYGVERDDTRYTGIISFSRKFLYDWLGIAAEFNYMKNDSNISDYEYERKITSLSVTANY
ncbi:tetratricopeptide repeat protein [Desulfococcaceae bacterium HSG8]|nr:tetratricopeptide repeat protein [Desulfococcaceae bacterium HSG8]